MSDLLLFADTETTGIPDFKKPADAPGQPRVASLAGIVVRKVDWKVMWSFDLRVRPDGWEMPPELEKVHGLTTELLRRVGLPIGQVLSVFETARAQGALPTFHNAGFDLKLLRGELRRLGQADMYGEPYQCTYLSTPYACHQEAGNRKLGTVYTWLTGKPPPIGAAHTAMGDAMMVREVYRGLMLRGVDLTPRRYEEKQ